MYNDNTSTIPSNNESMIHQYKMQHDPEYAANYRFQQETANQALEDTSLDLLLGGGLVKGVVKELTLKNTPAQLATKTKLEDRGLYNHLIELGVEETKNKQLGKKVTQQLFDNQGLAKQADIQEAVNKAYWNNSKLADELGKKYNDEYKGLYRLP